MVKVTVIRDDDPKRILRCSEGNRVWYRLWIPWNYWLLYAYNFWNSKFMLVYDFRRYVVVLRYFLSFYSFTYKRNF